MSDLSAELRAHVRARAKRRCEYCFTPENLTLVSHEIDHVIALKHGGETVPENLALCCTICNKHKGSDIASIDRETGNIQRLFHPRNDCWHDHFQLRGHEIVPCSGIGRVTVQLLQLNRPERLKER